MKRHTVVRGFTIVELIIVIVVIAILATLVTVGYQNAQKQSRDGVRDSAVHTIRQALELYSYNNSGAYPNACNGTNGCDAQNLASYLTPAYLKSIPADPKSGQTIDYVRSGGSGTGYGLKVQYETKTVCKYLGGTNSKDTNNSWWGTGTPVCKAEL